MKQGLICELSPLCRPVSQRKLRRRRLIAGKKEGPGRITPKSHQTELSQDNDAFEQSLSKSPGTNYSDILSKSSKGVMRTKQVQALKKGSYKLRTQHHLSDLSLQAGLSDGLILPSNKSCEVKTGPVLAGSTKGPNPHPQRDNRACLEPDLSNGKESHRSLSAASKSPGFQSHYKGMLSISPSPVLASLTKIPEADSQRNNETGVKQHQIKKSDQNLSDPSQSYGVQERHIVDSPGKQTRSMHVSDKLNLRPRVTLVAVDMNKISETTDFDIKKRKMDSQLNDSDIALNTSVDDISGLSSVNSQSIIIDDSLAILQQGSVDDNPQGTGKSHDQQVKINRKKSSSPGTLLATGSSRGAPKSSSLSHRTQLPLRGKLPRHRTVSMTTVDMKKLKEAYDILTEKKEDIGKRVADNQPHDPENLLISERNEIFRSKSSRGKAECFPPGVSSSKSEDSGKLQIMDSELQGINDIDPPSEVALRKKHASSLSKSPRMRKRRKSLPYLSPGKQLLSQSMHGLDKIHRRRTVSMTTVEKLQDAINSQISRKRKRREETEHGEHDFSLSTSDHDVSRSSSSSGVEANAFWADLISSKTKDSSQNTEYVAAFQRLDCRHQKYAMTERKESSPHIKGPGALERLEKGKQGSSVPVITPANSVLPQGMKDLGSTDFTIRKVATENTKKQFQEATNIPRKRTLQQAPEMRDTAVASKKKKQKEIFVNPSGFGVPIKSGRTPELNFKKLDEMYRRRFDPNQECTEVQNVNTICRIRSFQDRQKESRKGNKSDIQRYAFTGDMDETESDVSDSDEANETLLEREIRSFFESTGDSKEFKEGELTGDETRSQGLQVTDDGVSDDEVPEAGQILPLPNDLTWTDKESSMGIAHPIENIPDKIADSICDVEHVLKTDLSTFNDTPSSSELGKDLTENNGKYQKNRDTENQKESSKDSLDGLQDGLHTLVDMQRLTKRTCTNTLEKLNDSGSMQNFVGSIISILDSQEDIENLPELTNKLPRPDSNYESIESETVFKSDCYKKAALEGEDKKVQDEAKAHTTSYDFGDSFIMDSEEEGLWEDACTPYQHSTPTGQAHHHGARITAIPDDFNMAFKAIKKERKLFMLFCHVGAAHCILEDLGKCPDIIDERSLSLRYLKDKPSVVVEGMTVDDCTVVPCQSYNKKEITVAERKKTKKKKEGDKDKSSKKKKKTGKTDSSKQKEKKDGKKKIKEKRQKKKKEKKEKKNKDETKQKKKKEETKEKKMKKKKKEPEEPIVITDSSDVEKKKEKRDTKKKKEMGTKTNMKTKRDARDDKKNKKKKTGSRKTTKEQRKNDPWNLSDTSGVVLMNSPKTELVKGNDAGVEEKKGKKDTKKKEEEMGTKTKKKTKRDFTDDTKKKKKKTGSRQTTKEQRKNVTGSLSDYTSGVVPINSPKPELVKGNDAEALEKKGKKDTTKKKKNGTGTKTTEIKKKKTKGDAKEDKKEKSGSRKKATKEKRDITLSLTDSTSGVVPNGSPNGLGAVEKKFTKKKKKEMGTKTKEEKKKKTKGRSKDGTQKKKTSLRKQTKEEKKNVTSSLAYYISGMVVQ